MHDDNADIIGISRRSLIAATIGNMLEFYDFITYSFFAIHIGHAFFPTRSAFASLMLSLATFGAGFLTRPIGALVIGAFSDRAGRRPAMILSFGMMGVAITTLAVTPSYATIGVCAPIIAIVARLVQGFSLGGEVGPTTAYLMEAAAPDKRGLVVSWQPASQQIAATVGAVVGAVLSGILSSEALDSYGWRIALLLGVVRSRSVSGYEQACQKPSASLGPARNRERAALTRFKRAGASSSLG